MVNAPVGARGRFFMNTKALTDLDILYQSGKKCAKGVRWKASTQKYLYDNLLYAFLSKKKLQGRKKIHEGFVVFRLIERGKEREAYSIHIRERVVQRTLSDYALMPYVLDNIVDRNCASIKGKGEIYAERALKQDLYTYYIRHGTNKGFAVKLDASSYFNHIPQSAMIIEFHNIDDNLTQHLVLEFANSYRKCAYNVQRQIKAENVRIRNKLKNINQLKEENNEILST